MGTINIFISGEGNIEAAEEIKGMIENFAAQLSLLSNLNYSVQYTENI